ncbi:heterokaryon incompatibility protein-domain-containing protein [Stachybotrys elegans]|uniref:Heterokaryon incompatibility protein-domain-containing protein n=1 Tax=Stachybotrys elegans TaxID=80388 RepID=A0A8K0WXZ1_9HYPO|nr:heterokaryon incompatibility protein-domain-containing protein [Stachybotrys elegans]
MDPVELASKRYRLESSPFKADDVKHAAAITGPFFRYDANVLCPACKELLTISLEIERLGVPQGIYTPFTFQDICDSATLGCHLCSLFYVAMMQTPKDTGEEFLTYPASFNMLPSTKALALNLRKPGAGSTGPRDLLYICGPDSSKLREQEDLPPGLTPVTLGRSTEDEETISLAQSWLEMCLQEHGECAKPTAAVAEEDRLERLLDLDGGVRLVDARDTKGAPYVALSHCWGKEHLIRLLLNNEAEFRQGKIEGFPKTFLDAIQVTRQLGYRYIWIDSLCIIQDSKEDWEEQAKTMARIYSNSAFTIAALKSSGSREGCFTTERNPLGLRTLHVDHLGISVVKGRPESLWEMEVGIMGRAASPLHSRAWVVQERYSSPRTLLYGKHGIYWECRCAQASEGYYRKVDPDGQYNRKTWLQRLARSRTDQDDEYSEHSWMKHWLGLLRAYSACELTVKTDKIIAVTGLISEIERLSDHDRKCILGIWNHDLPRMLLWSHQDTELSGRLHNWMPSWSWASIEGACGYMVPSGKVDYRAEVTIDETCTPPALIITSLRIAVEQDEQVSVFDPFDEGDEEEEEPNTLDDYCALIVKPGEGQSRDLDLDPYTWFPDCGKPDAENPLYLVQVLRFLSSEPETWASWCLVVTPNDGGDTYKRVGLCIVRFSSLQDDPFEKLGSIEATRIL